jgi:isopentenyl-diphosphate Delta-isomerase
MVRAGSLRHMSGEELIDIIDAHGVLTGIAVPRTEAHAKGLWHRTVHVWLINSRNELLIQKRAANKESHPNLWDISCAGHIKSGQTSQDAAICELQEELGIVAGKEALQPLFSLTERTKDNSGTFIDNEVNDVYLLKNDSDISAFLIDTNEVADVRWIGIDELNKERAEHLRRVVPHDEEYSRLLSIIEKQI